MINVQKQLIELLADTVDDPEVLEVCHYIIHSDTMMMMAHGAQQHMMTATPHIPPEVIMLVSQYASGMVNNGFYHKNFAVISNAVTMDHIRFKVMYANLKHGDDSRKAAIIVRDMIARKYDALGQVVFLYAGYNAMFEFEMKFRGIVMASEEDIKACKSLV